MHPLYRRADELSGVVIGAAIEVHRLKGPGLLESIYQKCLGRELELRGVGAEQEVVVPVEYKGFVFDEPMRLDVWVERCLLIELKTVERILPIHKAQLMYYMRLLSVPLGLLINFSEPVLKKGLHRLILPGADAQDVDF